MQKKVIVIYGQALQFASVRGASMTLDFHDWKTSCCNLWCTCWMTQVAYKSVLKKMFSSYGLPSKTCCKFKFAHPAKSSLNYQIIQFIQQHPGHGYGCSNPFLSLNEKHCLTIDMELRKTWNSGLVFCCFHRRFSLLEFEQSGFGFKNVLEHKLNNRHFGNWAHSWKI